MECIWKTQKTVDRSNVVGSVGRYLAKVVVCFGIEYQRNNQAVEPKNFGENEDKDSGNIQSPLLAKAASTSVTDNPNAPTSCQSSKAHT